MQAYQHLKSPKNTGPGISEYMLVAPVTDFVDIKCPVAPFDGQPIGESIQILQAHEFVAGRGFVKIHFAPEKNQITGKTIGDLMFQKMDFELKGFIPGSYAEEHEQVANMINVPLIVLVKDSNCPAKIWYQFGCDCTGAYLKADFLTGTTKDGAKGYDISVSWQNPYVQFYSHVDGPEILD